MCRGRRLRIRLRISLISLWRSQRPYDEDQVIAQDATPVLAVDLSLGIVGLTREEIEMFSCQLPIYIHDGV